MIGRPKDRGYPIHRSVPAILHGVRDHEVASAEGLHFDPDLITTVLEEPHPSPPPGTWWSHLAQDDGVGRNAVGKRLNPLRGIAHHAGPCGPADPRQGLEP